MKYKTGKNYRGVMIHNMLKSQEARKSSFKFVLALVRCTNMFFNGNSCTAVDLKVLLSRDKLLLKHNITHNFAIAHIMLLLNINSYYRLLPCEFLS